MLAHSASPQGVYHFVILEACVAWRRLVDSTELWHIASPRRRLRPSHQALHRQNCLVKLTRHRGVMDRIVWKSKICERRF